jgi:archaellum biogenesis ATPase FlaH
MNSIRVRLDDEKCMEFSEDGSEMLLLKQLLNPVKADYAPFIIDNFEKRWLKTESHKSLFEIGQAFWRKYQKAPSKKTMQMLFQNKKYEQLQDKLERDYSSIVEFNEEELEPDMVKGVITTFVKNRSIQFAIYDNMSTLETTGENSGMNDMIDKLEKAVNLDLNTDLGVEYFDNFNNHCAALCSKESKTPFGFKQLDMWTYGGIPNDDTCMIIIMAQPGLGKSQFMMNIAANWVKMDKKVLMLSLEMSEQMYSKRMSAIFADMEVNSLGDSIEDVKRLVMGMKAGLPHAKLQIKEYPTGTMSASMLKQYLKKLEQEKKFKPDIIFVDYLNIMKPNNVNQNMSLYEKCAKISEELRAISCERKIPIISAVQQNRSKGGYAGENLDLSDVSESSGISATCDAMYGLFVLDGDRENEQINVKIIKNRLGGHVGDCFRLFSSRTSLKMGDLEYTPDTGNGRDTLLK